MGKYQEICLGMPKLLTEQSLTYEKNRRTLYIRRISMIMVEN